MAILEGYHSNFQILGKAFENEDVGLVECTDKATGKKVVTICAITKMKDEFQITPLAKMFDGNPFDELNPPT